MTHDAYDPEVAVELKFGSKLNLSDEDRLSAVRMIYADELALYLGKQLAAGRAAVSVLDEQMGQARFNVEQFLQDKGHLGAWNAARSAHAFEVQSRQERAAADQLALARLSGQPIIRPVRGGDGKITGLIVE